MAGIPEPSDAGPCDHTEFNIGASATLSPGTYCGGITIYGSSSVTLDPGIYILRGGGLKVLGGSSIQGTGVGFYNTSGSGYSYGAIELGAGSNAQLAAPAGGEMRGTLFFQDRSAPSGVVNKIESGSTSWFEGTFYFPTQHLKLAKNI